MKPNARFRELLLGSFLLAAPAHASIYYWDVDGETNVGFGTVVGTWNTTNNFWNTDATGSNGGSVTNTTTSADDLIIPQATTNTGTLTITGTQSASSITFAADVGGTLTLSGGSVIIGGSGSSSGIFQQSTSANTISSALTLNSANTAFDFSNSSAGLLTIGAVTGAISSGTQTITLASSSSGNIALTGTISNGSNGGNVGLTINNTSTGITTFTGTSSSYSGQLTVQNGTLSIGAINNASANGTLGNSANSVILGGSGGQTGILQYTGGSATSTKAFTLATGGTGVVEVTNAATTLTLQGMIDGGGNLTKTGAGTLTLYASDGNYGIIPMPRFTGVTQVTGGKIKYSTSGFNNGDEYILFNSAFNTAGSTGGVGLDITGASNPWFGGLLGSEDLGTAIAVGYGSVASVNLNVHNGNSYTYDGIIANGAATTAFNKQGNGTQTFTNAQTYSGATTVKAGTLVLGGANGSVLNSVVTVKSGTLSLDNSTAWINRLDDTKALSLGSLNLISTNGSGVQSETVGATTFAVGGKVAITNGATLGDQTTFAMGAVTRSVGAAIDFVGVNGTLGSGANSPNITSTGAFPGVSNGILAWATVNGTQWAEDNAGSIRAYSGTFVDPTSAASDATKNAQLTGTGSMGSSKSFNSLNVISSAGSQSLDLGANILTLTSGGILKSGTDAYEIKGSNTNAITIGASNELIAHVDGGALTISAKLKTSIVNIAKGGTGDLILSGTRAGTMNGAISIAGGNLEFQGLTTSLTGVISGAGNLVANLNAGQILTISNTGNTYSGSTIVNGGILRVGTAYNTQGLPNGGNSGQIGTSNLEINNGIVSIPYYVDLGLGSGPGQFQITGGTSGFSGYGNNPTFNIFGDAKYEVVWGAANEAGNANATGYFNPSVFVLGDSVSSNQTMQWNNGIDLNGSTRTISNTSAYVTTIGGLIRTSSGSAGFTKEGAGILAFTNGSNSWNGSTTVNAGLLHLGGMTNANLGGGSGRNVTVANGAAIGFNAASNTLLNRIVETTDEIGIMTSTTANNLDFSSSTGANLPNAFLGNWAGNGAKAEYSGTMTFGGSNYRLGAKGSNGLLGIVGTNKLTGTQGLLVGGTGGSSIRVELAGANDFTGDTVINTGAKLTLGNNLALQNSVLNLGSAGGTFALSTGALSGRITGDIASPNPTFGGLSGSRSLFSAFSASGSNNEQLLAATAVTGFTLNTGNGVNVTFSGAIGGFGTGASGGLNGASTLTKTGAGTQILTGVSTYTGATTISNGTLAVNGAGSINNSSGVIVASGAQLTYNSSTALTTTLDLQGSGISNRAVLGGSGTIGVAVTLNDIGDVLAPGNSPGVQTYTVNQTWSSFSYDWELNNWTNQVAGSNIDQVAISGTLDLTGNAINNYYLNILSLDGSNASNPLSNFTESNNSWTILTTTSGITGFNASYWNLNAAGFQNTATGTWSLAQSGNDLVLSYTVIPEPSVALLGSLGLLTLLRRRRD